MSLPTSFIESIISIFQSARDETVQMNIVNSVKIIFFCLDIILPRDKDLICFIRLIRGFYPPPPAEVDGGG